MWIQKLKTENSHTHIMPSITATRPPGKCAGLFHLLTLGEDRTGTEELVPEWLAALASYQSQPINLRVAQTNRPHRHNTLVAFPNCFLWLSLVCYSPLSKVQFQQCISSHTKPTVIITRKWQIRPQLAMTMEIHQGNEKWSAIHFTITHNEVCNCDKL